MSASEEIYPKVVKVLAETLNVDEDEVTPTATLQGGLGAESIDFLDIVFRLERTFDIRIPNDELFPGSIFQGDPEWVQNGMVTEQGLAELCSRMPYANLAGFARDRRLSAVPDLFTVDLLARYITWKLGHGSAAYPDGRGPVAVTAGPVPGTQE